ncbi:hypothetical protein AB1M95_16375 [Sulfitobacter sp. LCG007]
MARITDEKSAKAWLETQPDQVRVWFAARCALRLLPLLKAIPAPVPDRAMLSYFRAMLLAVASQVKVSSKQSDLRPALEAAQAAADEATFWAQDLAQTDNSVTYFDLAIHIFGIASSTAGVAAGSKESLSRVVSATMLATGDLEYIEEDAFGERVPELRRKLGIAATADMSDLLQWSPLWPGSNLPDQLGAYWEGLRNRSFQNRRVWGFWIDWYQAILDGEPMPWDLTFRIASEVTEAQWDAGPEAVAEAIEDIRETFERAEEAEAATTPPPTEAEKASVAEKVSANREALALTIAGLLERLSEFRERLRGANDVDPDTRDELLEFIDTLSSKLAALLSSLPVPGTEIDDDTAGRIALWWREYKALLGQKAVKYVSPDNVSEATIPAAIVLGCTAVGAMVGGTGGGAIGVVVGGLITGQISTAKAASDLWRSGSPKTSTGETDV